MDVCVCGEDEFYGGHSDNGVEGSHPYQKADDTSSDPLLVRSETYGYLGLHNTAFGQRLQRGTMVPPDEWTLGGRMLWRKSTLDRYLKTHKDGQKYVWPQEA